MHAEIAGAGFAGLAAAIALRRRGWSVRVHEREPELRAFGAGIFIWENGQRVLQAIGAYDDVARGAHQAPGYETRRNGACVSFEKINGANRFLLQTMTRQHLYSAIIASAQREGIEIVTRSEAVGARPEGVLDLADGQSLKADLVIAADGVRSAVRDSLGVAVARHKYQDGIVRVLVDRAPFLGGDWEHVIDFWAFEPRTLRILYAPCEGGKLYFAMMSPREDKEASTLPIDPAVWGSVFPMLTPALQTIGTRGRYDVYETTRLDSWSVGRVAIVGDAAHALPPTLAQGLPRNDEHPQPGGDRDWRIGRRGVLATLGGPGAGLDRPHASPLRRARTHARTRSRHAMGRHRPARGAACADRHPAGGVRAAQAVLALALQLGGARS